MKIKILFLLIFFSSLTAGFIDFAEIKSTDKVEPTDKKNSMTTLNKKEEIPISITYFKKLSKDDKFKVSYDSSFVKVYDTKNNLLLEKDGASWGSHQFSRNRRKLIIFGKKDSNFPYHDELYLLDGDKGTCAFLMKNWSNAMSNVDIKYILCQQSLNNVLNLAVFNIEKKTFEKIELPIKNPAIVKKSTYTVLIYRSENPMYDFLVDLNFDDYVAAEYGFCIKNMVFTEIFDETLNTQTNYKRYKEPTDFQVGW